MGTMVLAAASAALPAGRDRQADLLVGALEHTPVTDVLRPGLAIRTQLEPFATPHEARVEPGGYA